MDAEAEAPILWPPDAELTHWKIPMLGKTEGKRRRGWQKMRWSDSITDSRHELEQIPGDSEGQGSLA